MVEWLACLLTDTTDAGSSPHVARYSDAIKKNCFYFKHVFFLQKKKNK